MTTGLCVIATHDEPRSAHHGHLCRNHLAEIQQNLAEMPALILEVAKHVRATSQGGPKVSGTKDKPLPFNEVASDAWRFARDTLASWSSLVSEELEITPPLPMIDETSRFLLRWLEWISQQGWVGEFVGEQNTARKGLRAVLSPSRTKRVPLGPCDSVVACDVTTASDVVCPGILRALIGADDDQLPQVITCSDCGQTYEPTQWRALSRRLRGGLDPMLTAAQISMTLRVPLRTVRRWADEDEWRNTGQRPNRFHQDDAQTSYDRHHIEAETA